VTYIDKKHRRVSAETAYLTREVLKRKNLTVAIHATTTRVLFDTTNGNRPRAIGVEFGSKEGGPTWKAYAKKEVIIS
jgi:choline dehydrogenase